MKQGGWVSQGFMFCFWCLTAGMREGGESKISFWIPGVWQFPLTPTASKVAYLVCVECLQMIKSMLNAILFIGGWCYSE